MKLEELFDEVSDICYDSRDVTRGALFFALRGARCDGKDYISDAISRGARAIVVEGESEEISHVSGALIISVKNIRETMAFTAAKFFAPKLEHIVAVTGTNGKTSISDITRQLWSGSGIEAASIGTLGVVSDKITHPLKNHMTCPLAIDLQKILRELGAALVKNVILEASSHGIDQNRIGGIHFDVCAFTNFSEDHLDYHIDMENYFLAKEKLFRDFATPDTVFVINADDPKAERLLNTSCKTITYGFKGKDIKILSLDIKENCELVKVDFFGKIYEISIPLMGDFQVYNALCAAGICKMTGVNDDNLLFLIQKLKPINARLEFVSNFNGAQIFVDFAHTEDALEKAIRSLKRHANGRFITLFGCGGDRDAKKRPLMGRAACQNSNVVIVTDDNPRHEDPQSIRNMILSGCDKKAVEIADRKEAIRAALKMLLSGDILLIAGKGHEDYQEIGDKLIPFSDRRVLLDLIKEM